MLRSKALAVALLCALAAGCAGSSASYTRFRREASAGRVIAAEEVRASELIAYHAQADAPRGAMTAPGAGSGLAIEAAVGNPVLPAVASRPVLQVSLRGTAGLARRPANLVVAVDLSGSMQEGDKIGAVRHALARLVETLDDEDRISIVTFADHASGLGPVRVGEHRASLLSAVGRLRAGGGTNLHAALERALGLAAAGRWLGGASRLVLLSDGMPTAGVTDRGAILGLAGRFRDHGVSVTTVGLGDRIDDALLSGIARQADGQYRYLDRPSEVERVFAAELRGLTEASAREVEVRVALPPGWSFFRAYDERTSLAAPGLAVSRVGDLAGDEAAVLVYELEAPAGLPGGGACLAVDVTFASPAEPGRRAAARAQVELSRSGAPSYHAAPGGSILRNLALGRIAHALREADLARRRGDRGSAVLLVRGALAQTREARAALAAAGEAGLAASLAEPEALVDRTASTLAAEAAAAPPVPAPPAGPVGSAAWSHWGAASGTVVIPPAPE